MKKENKDLKCEQDWKKLEGYTKEYKLDLRKVSERQFRVGFMNKMIIDVFPVSQKYFDYTGKKWGTYEDVIFCVDKYFSEE